MSDSASLAESAGDRTDDLGTARRARAEACAHELEILARRYTELARHLQKPIRDIMSEAARTTSRDRDFILSALENNCHTYAEIAEWTNRPYQTVYKLLHQPPLVYLVEFRKNPPLSGRGRGGLRRPEILIWLRQSLPLSSIIP